MITKTIAILNIWLNYIILTGIFLKMIEVSYQYHYYHQILCVTECCATSLRVDHCGKLNYTITDVIV